VSPLSRSFDMILAFSWFLSVLTRYRACAFAPFLTSSFRSADMNPTVCIYAYVYVYMCVYIYVCVYVSACMHILSFVIS
jgi:hypothetical protein